ncbi:hypothetical protein Hdeb2414_s0016g00479351 [Helianthus debilis subsp. tardiflorus]
MFLINRASQELLFQCCCICLCKQLFYPHFKPSCNLNPLTSKYIFLSFYIRAEITPVFVLVFGRFFF